MDTEARARRSIDLDELQRIAGSIRFYSYNGISVRAVDNAGQRWVVFADVCRAVGYKNPNHESKKLELAEKCKLEIGLKNTKVTGVNKRGLLRFALYANQRNVSDFQDWADSEIFNDGAG